MSRGHARWAAAAFLGVALLLAARSGAARAESESERLVALLGVRAGATVADVGAGEGRWTIELSAAVGPEGRVLATEVEDDLLEGIRRRMAEEKIANVEVVRGDQRSTGLPAGCCDAILLRLVYHHFVDPEAMSADLARALRSAGRLVIVETRPQHGWRRLEGVPERGGHGIEIEDLIAEMKRAGFQPVERQERWNGDDDRYAVVFERTAGSE